MSCSPTELCISDFLHVDGVYGDDKGGICLLMIILLSFILIQIKYEPDIMKLLMAEKSRESRLCTPRH